MKYLITILLFSTFWKANCQYDSLKTLPPRDSNLVTEVPFNAKKNFFVNSPVFNKKRTIGVGVTTGALWAGTMTALGTVWYKDIPKSKFHGFNDGDQWLQMDKLGHVMTTWWISKTEFELLRWAGVPRKKAIWIGAGFGLAYQTTLEILDGFSSDWGFSMWDITANVIGAGLFVGQQFLWNEQRIKLKYSFWESGIAHHRPELLGRGFFEQALKDYNGQTYWLSVNLASFMKKTTKFPKWLNVAIGYSADGMVYGSESKPVTIYDNNGAPIEFERKRQFLLSLDIDLTKFNVKKPFWRAVLNLFNSIKIPFPAIEFSNNKVKGHWIYF